MEGSQKDDAYGSVPFLNLNLFHETSLDVLEWDVPDTLLQFLLGRNGLFYNYNFNIDEFDSREAVTPEIIGTIFEELMTDRQEKGAFYTPKPVVGYMCTEGIKLILDERTNLPSEQIMGLVDQDSL